jgi:hypothetical protein
MRFRPRLSKWVLLYAAVPLFCAMLVLLRGRPTIRSDAGIFLSVAARLIRGDRLYSGVWDNKPPFFYYTYALALDALGWRGPFLLDIGWISLAAAGFALLLRSAGVSFWPALAGSALYPILLTGAWYSAGYSELPPLALVPWVGWLWLRGNAASAGIVIGVAAFYRPDYLPLFAAVIVAPYLARVSPRAGLRASFLRLVGGIAVASAAAVAVLAARDELHPYIETIREDLGYPGRTLVQLGEPPGVRGHAKVALGLLFKDRPRAVFFGLVCALLLLLIVSLRRRRPHMRLSTPFRVLAALLVTTVASAALILALTAVWYHNLELLAVPAAFAGVLLAQRSEQAVRGLSRRLAAVAASTAVCALAFGGFSLDHSGSPESSWPLSNWTRTPRSPSATALDREAGKSAARGKPVTYARLGSNDDDAHAVFISRVLALACPVFHQYTYTADLSRVVSCIRDRLPDLVLTSPSFVAVHGATTRRWDAFVAASDELLRERYVDALRMPAPQGELEVWRRR